MGKNQKTGLGRALVRNHNQMIEQYKEKGQFYRNQHKKFLESVTEISDIEAVIGNSDDADLLYTFSHPSPSVPIRLDGNASTSGLSEEERKEQQKKQEALHESSLRVPRRPPWRAGMSVDELDANERQSFVIWRRSLARLEDNEKLILTPFEKNLDIWRQLWRVVERSDLLVMVIDARDPLFYRCPDLEAYAREVDEHKKTLLLVNKADLLPYSVRKKWAKYFHDKNLSFAFWSAKSASATLEGKTLSVPWMPQDNGQESDPDTKIYGREELLAHLQSEAEQVAKIKRQGSNSVVASRVDSNSGSDAESSARKNVVVGFVGYPNVGKSSTINALVGQKRTGVTSTPGKTKHFQTLIISDELTLCDCPGLVFPSFSSSRHEMVASGVLPIDRMTDHREAVQVVADQVSRNAIEGLYGIKLPRPKPYEPQSRPPLATELLRAYCASRGYVASSGLPDETRAARQLLKDYVDGKLPHYQMPPDMNDDDNFVGNHLSDIHESDESDAENPSNVKGESATVPDLDHVLDDLDSFDVSNGLAANKVANKKPSASLKHHKKPQRKKDRSWRVGNDGGDGMPVVRVFQKPVNTGPIRGI